MEQTALLLGACLTLLTTEQGALFLDPLLVSCRVGKGRLALTVVAVSDVHVRASLFDRVDHGFAMETASFEKAGQVMSYTGMVPSEHSSGPKTRRGAITKTGNSHLRRVLVESAWHYRHQPKLCKLQKELQTSLSPKVAAIAWSAQQRLHRRYWALQNKSKPSAKIVTALARELAGFVWAIGVETERALNLGNAA